MEETAENADVGARGQTLWGFGLWPSDLGAHANVAAVPACLNGKQSIADEVVVGADRKLTH